MHFSHSLTSYKISVISSICLSLTCINTAQAESNWYVKPNVGLSSVSDFTAGSDGIAMQAGPADIMLDSGFTAGIAIGYDLGPQWAAELAWEYRSNDSRVNLPNQVVFDSGNYASNMFALNGVYKIGDDANWQPYLGAGLTWMQEIDIDLGGTDEELSFSSDGDFGFQVFAGVSYPLNDKWSLQGELRYGRTSGIDLSPESGQIDLSGAFKDFEYDVSTMGISASYQF